MKPSLRRVMVGCLVTTTILVTVPIAIALAARYGIPMLEVGGICAMGALMMLLVAKSRHDGAHCDAAVKAAHTMADILNKETPAASGERYTMDTLKTAFEASSHETKVRVLMAMYCGLNPECVEAQHICELLEDPLHTVEDVEQAAAWLKEKTA